MNIKNFHEMMTHAPAAEFATDEAAEDYVLAHPDAIAVVVKKRIVVATYFGKAHERKESK